jgi:uncharacterized membrane protein YqjE
LDIIQRFRSIAKVLFAQLELHGQLARVEWAEEKNRLQQMIAISIVGFACLLCALLFAGFIVAALSWATDYRIIAIAAMFSLYIMGLGLCVYRFNILSARSSATFSATREEIAADLELMRSRL